MTQLHSVSRSEYVARLDFAQRANQLVGEYTTSADDMPHGADYFMSADGASGFGITSTGELVGLFSLVGGRGNDLVGHAVSEGATRLDCFDGYLVQLYARHGFEETRREANWTVGEPDVVYMARMGK